MSPIRPENRRHYTRASGWPAVRATILERSKGLCEFCGVRNHATGYRNRSEFIEIHGDGEACEARADGFRLIRIILTIAHLNHVAGDDRAENLRALCQQCHLRHDAEQHAETSRRTRAEKNAQPGQGVIDL